MKYVVLGSISPQWAARQDRRTKLARAMAKRLGIKIESVNYTQGDHDFVDIVELPTAEAMLAFSVWYANCGLGRMRSMPAFSEKAFAAASGRARKK